MIDITIKNLTKSFGAITALDDINLHIDAGELFFLLGPSGCGKTTLLRTLAGFYIPDMGTISFGEKNITNLPPHKRKAGMVFQNYALWPHMTVYQNVAFGLEQKKLKKSDIYSLVNEALENVQMSPYANRKPNELSGGQQQRVALARALVVRPKCLLLDEPLSNLDAKLRNDMRGEIRKICKENNLTTVYVTHDQKEALSIADRVAVFSRGKIEQIGPPIELYKRPNNRFVAEFIGETNLIDGVVIRVGAHEAFVRTRIGNFRGMLCKSSFDVKPGEKVRISIRPESIKLCNFPTDENCTEGMIGSSTYFGEVAHYQFEKNDIELKISELNPCHLGQIDKHGMYAYAIPEDVIILGY
ncbi:MAG: ABC transporter ATP-binding protein [Puniceicoccales bacterium]|jgi:iron(III) transport system ATP-binding protein|nr:ABC transporter ATP-binding protein [Puniceicoccales bacterium]